MSGSDGYIFSLPYTKMNRYTPGRQPGDVLGTRKIYVTVYGA